MKLFFKGLSEFALLPLIFAATLIALYSYFDPFKVLYSYKDYSYSPVTPSRDYMSTEMFIKNRHKYNYNSFIFGSSRTLAYRPASWAAHLDKGAIPFMFDASGESIYGIYTKLKYLDSTNADLRNALIIICRDATFQYSRNHRGRLALKHPLVTGESKFIFHLESLRAYFDLKFLFSYYAFLLTKEYKPFMYGFIEERGTVYDTITNQISFPEIDSELAKSPEEYYAKRENIFYARNGEQTDSYHRINDRQVFMLKEVKRILEKNNTNYKVVTSPLYDQMKFSKHDFDILKNIFGDKLYDFSGKNSFTEPKTNYYENSHYRPHVGDSIFNIIY